jgi:pyruvate dehydrogenase E2 component (dihydrolipoamide acetyltransferase)
METGSISKWNVKVGDKFEPGSSLCDVETDKATMSFDATDDGFVAKIFVATGDIKVGQPLLVTVDALADVQAFADFTIAEASGESGAVAVPAPPAAVAPAVAVAVAAAPSPTAPAVPRPSGGERIFASPLAKKLVRDGAISLDAVHAALQGVGTGFNGRIVASDVQRASEILRAQPVMTTSAVAVTAAATVPVDSITTANQLSLAQALSERQTLSKKTVPHYHVSMEINMSATLALREKLNGLVYAAQRKEDPSAGITVMDFVAKAAAQAMKQVPDVNGALMETFVRKYEQVRSLSLSLSLSHLISSHIISSHLISYHLSLSLSLSHNYFTCSTD